MKVTFKIVGLSAFSLVVVTLTAWHSTFVLPAAKASTFHSDKIEVTPAIPKLLPSQPSLDQTGKPEGKWYDNLQSFWMMAGWLLVTGVTITAWRYYSLRSFSRLQELQIALRESEARYRTVVEDQTELICRFLPDGTLTFVNQAYARYFHQTSAKLIGKSFFPFLIEKEQQKVQEKIAAVNQDRPIFTHEHRLITARGKICWQQWTNRGLFDEQGKLIELQAVGRDITKLKETQIALLQLNQNLEKRFKNRKAELEREIVEKIVVETNLDESKQKYQRLVESIPALVYQFSLKRGGIFYSAHTAKVLGYSLEELYQNPWLWNNSIHPEDLPKVQEKRRQFVVGKNFEIEYRLEDAQGNWHWLRDRSIGRQQKNDEVIIEGIALDITQSKQAEIALRQAHQELGFHLENSPLAVVEWDSEFRIKFWSSQAEVVFGWQAEEVLGKSWQDWQFVFEDDLEIVRDYTTRLTNGTEARQFCFNRNYHKSGRLLHCEWYNSVLLNELGNLVSILSLVLDVSDRQQALEALQESETRLQMALSGSGEYIWDWKVKTGEIQVQDSWLETLGYEAAAITPNFDWFLSIIHPDSLPQLTSILRDYLGGKTKFFETEVQIRTKFGDYLWISLAAQCVSADIQGKPLKTLGTYKNITARKQSEEALRQQRELMQTILDHIPVMIVLFDQDHQYQYKWVNREFERVLGWSLAEMQGKNMLAEFYPNPTYRQQVINFIQTSGGVWSDFKLHLRDGTIFDTSWAAVQLSDGRIIGIGQNISQRKRMEEALRDSEEKYRLLFESNPNPLWVYDLETLAFLEVNQMAIEHYGYSRQEFLEMTIVELQVSQDLLSLESYTTANQYNLHRSGLGKHRKKNGEIIDVEMISHSLQFSGREARLILIHDVTENLQAEQALLESEERFRRAVVDAPLPIMIHAENGEVLSINKTWTQLTGYTHEQIPTIADWIELAYGAKKNLARSLINQLYQSDVKINQGELPITISSGETRIWELSSAPLGRLSDGRKLVISMALDITESKKIEEQLRYTAFHDALTGLPNRYLLMDRVEQAIRRSQRVNAYLFALLFVDLDRFKMINDSLGHLMGDQLLEAIAHKLKLCARESDTVARLGGDEFIILLDNLHNHLEALRIAERIIHELKLPFQLGGREFFVSASIGIAFNSSNSAEMDQVSTLLRNADLAMYEAKAQGKACYAIYESTMHTRVSHTLNLETDLRLAFERQEFLVYYQPIVSLTTEKLIGFEALIRWQHPEQGMIAPGEFIPLAEETGLIVTIGEWVLSEACRQLKQWQVDFPEITTWKISVNLSGRQIQQGNLSEIIDRILRETDLPGSNLKLEITESMLLENKESINDFLLAMRQRDIQISIDDFGTGYSSLSYLHYLSVNSLKIDRSFVIMMGNTEESLAIVEAIINLANNLGMDVIAEGIETKEQLETLKKLGCKFGQGYFFSKPLDAETVLKTNWNK